MRKGILLLLLPILLIVTVAAFSADSPEPATVSDYCTGDVLTAQFIPGSVLYRMGQDMLIRAESNSCVTDVKIGGTYSLTEVSPGVWELPYYYGGGTTPLPGTVLWELVPYPSGNPVTVSFVVDNTPPIVSNVQPSGTISIADTVINVDYADQPPISGISTESVSISLDGSELTGCSITETHAVCLVSGLSEGGHIITGSVASNTTALVLTTEIHGSFTVDTLPDTTAPLVTNVQPSGSIPIGDTTLSADYSDAESGIDTASVIVYRDGAPMTNCTVTDSNVNCPLVGLPPATYFLQGFVSDNAGNTSSINVHFTVEAPSCHSVNFTSPTEVWKAPGESITITGTFNGGDLYAGWSWTSGGFLVPMDEGSNAFSVGTYVPDAPGNYTMNFHEWFAPSGGISCGSQYVVVHVVNPVNYFWTWYDNISMRNWVLMANPAGSGKDLQFGLTVNGAVQNVGSGLVGQGSSMNFISPNLMGGPVIASSKRGDKAIVSQRSLMGNSFEEVLGTESSKLSSHFFWTWYDQKTLGTTDWVLVANPTVVTAYYQIKIAGQIKTTGSIDAGKNVTPTFAGTMGGPVEVLSCGAAFDQYTGQCNGAKPDLMASQRVLSNYGRAFNEVPGIPESELTSDYFWTWYDQKSLGTTDWVLVANPNDVPVYYQVKIGDEIKATDSLLPGANETPTFPGVMTGPVEVQSCAVAFDVYGQCNSPALAPIIASQRVLSGPSFEEIPGYPAGQLTSDYHWTWYDQASLGSTNWILVANSGDTAVSYEIKIGGVTMPTSSTNPGTIQPGQNVTPTFPGTMAGPVEVVASGDVMVSQRVLWNGYFNEVLGTVLN